MRDATTKRRLPIDSSVRASKGFRSLLVPVDLTPGSDRVLGRLSRLPLADDARVTLLHVIPGSLSPIEQRHAAAEVKKALGAEVRHLRDQLRKKITIVPLVKAGAAAQEIASSATEARADLIVMGRGGGRALRDSFIGSTAERVVRHARLPVLVVRLAPRAAYKRPALALDLDQAAHEVVRLMLRVLPLPPPRVDVIHAFDVPYRNLVYRSLSEHEVEEREEEIRSKATHDVQKVLATALAKADVRPENRPFWKIQVRYGAPRRVVEKVLKAAETDLLVLGTRGFSGAAYAFLGTVAGELLRNASCDVLVVPPRLSSRGSSA